MTSNFKQDHETLTQDANFNINQKQFAVQQRGEAFENDINKRIKRCSISDK